MRYIQSQSDHYKRAAGWPVRLGLRLFGGSLRKWDRRTAEEVDLFLANSHNVASRIASQYGRGAEVVHSPIDSEFFTPSSQAREDFFLIVSALVPYKRTELAIEAFNRLGLPLRVIGSGPEFRRLRRLALRNVTLMGWQPDAVVRDHYRRCRALIFPGEEDFGLVPLEAMACGAPVIALAAGGALETVLDVSSDKTAGPTGILFSPGTADGLMAAVRRFLQCHQQFQPDRLIAWARKFDKEAFTQGFRRALDTLLRQKGMNSTW